MSRELAPDQDGPQRSPHPRPPAQSANVTRAATGAAAPRTPAPLRTPAGLLGLQRLAGNRAVSALLSQSDPTVQRLPTQTGLKMPHAKKVYENHLKGDPPFKPQKGNFGEVSWFMGSGNAYVGGQAQKFDVMIDVDINPDPVLLRDEYFAQFVRQYVERTRADLKEPSTHHDFWVALGKSLEGGGSQRVPIDKSDVSSKEGGTFVVVGGSARESISLAKPAKLAADLGVHSAGLAKKVEDRRTGGTRKFAVVFDEVTPEQAKEGAPERALLALVRKPVTVGSTSVNIPGIDGGDQKVPATVKVTLTLSYADYSIARVEAKWLATAIGDGKLPGYTVGLLGGPEWSPKATEPYRRKREPEVTVIFSDVTLEQAQGANAPRTALGQLVTKPVNHQTQPVIKVIPGRVVGGQKDPDTAEFTFTLRYADYSTACAQAKKLETAINGGKTTGGYRVGLLGGPDWSAAWTKSYRPELTVIFDGVTFEQANGANAPGRVLGQLVTTPVNKLVPTKEITPASPLDPERAKFTFTLRYADYLTAQSQASKLAAKINAGRLDGYIVRLEAGPDWPRTAWTKSYRPVLTVIFDKVTHEQVEGATSSLSRLVTGPVNQDAWWETKFIRGRVVDGQKDPDTFKVTCNLRYADYKTACIQGKNLATAIKAGSLDGYTARLLVGSGWPRAFSRPDRLPEKAPVRRPGADTRR